MNSADKLRIFLLGLKSLERPLDLASFGHLLDSFMQLLQELEQDLTDPHLGLGVMVRIFEAEKDLFALCPKRHRRSLRQLLDELIGPLFALYATRYPDKAQLGQLILYLNKTDPYRLRETLFDLATLFLPKALCYTMIEELWHLVSASTSGRNRQRYLRAIVSLARQLRAPAVLEKACLALGRKASKAAVQDLVIILLETGDVRESARWAERVSFGAAHKNDCWEVLLLELYVHLGERRLAEMVAWRIFRRNREFWAFQELLDFIGTDQQDKVAQAEIVGIMQSSRIRVVDLEFLVEMEYFSEAEDYLLSHASELNGRPRNTLLPLAEQLSDAHRYLAATIIYRALLQSAVKRSTYDADHPARYLKELDRLSRYIQDWRGIASHNEFKHRFSETYRLESRLWQRYGLQSA
ncbi:MAG TPA: hypothetical protein V6D22_09835 [Candidatus Obscuribacterales bacterium]